MTIIKSVNKVSSGGNEVNPPEYEVNSTEYKTNSIEVKVNPPDEEVNSTESKVNSVDDEVNSFSKKPFLHFRENKKGQSPSLLLNKTDSFIHNHLQELFKI